MQFNVSDNSIETVSTERLVAGSVRIFTAEFRFDGSWDGYAKTAVFRAVERGGQEVRREMVISDGRCQVPHECLIENAYLCVGVYGIDGDRVRPTVWTHDFGLFVHPGAEPAQPGEEPTPDLWQQFVNTVREDASEAKDAAKAAEEVAEYVTGKEAWVYMEVGGDGCLYAVSGDALTTGFEITENGELEVLYV